MKKQTYVNNWIQVNNTETLSSENTGLQDTKSTCDTVIDSLERIMLNIQFLPKRVPCCRMEKIQEILTQNSLKTAFSHDSFTGEYVDCHGINMVPTVRRFWITIEKISHSIQHHQKWKSWFVNMFEDNIKHDNERYGFLSLVVFLTEALTKNIWFAFTSLDETIFIVKRSFALIGNYAFGTLLIYTCNPGRSLEHILLAKKSDIYGGLNE